MNCAAVALGSMRERSAEAVPALIEALNVAHFYEIMQALGDIGDPQAIPVLIDKLRDEAPAIRRLASNTAGQNA